MLQNDALSHQLAGSGLQRDMHVSQMQWLSDMAHSSMKLTYKAVVINACMLVDQSLHFLFALLLCLHQDRRSAVVSVFINTCVS